MEVVYVYHFMGAIQRPPLGPCSVLVSAQHHQRGHQLVQGRFWAGVGEPVHMPTQGCGWAVAGRPHPRLCPLAARLPWLCICYLGEVQIQGTLRGGWSLPWGKGANVSLPWGGSSVHWIWCRPSGLTISAQFRTGSKQYSNPTAELMAVPVTTSALFCWEGQVQTPTILVLQGQSKAVPESSFISERLCTEHPH